MKVVVTTTFEFEEDDVRDFMIDQGYENYTEEEVEEEFYTASASDLERYGIESSIDREVDVK